MISPARPCSRHEPRSRRPCVLTVDFDPSRDSHHFARFVFLYIFFRKGCKGCVKDKLPSRMSLCICSSPATKYDQFMLCVWEKRKATGPEWTVLRLFTLDTSRTIQQQYFVLNMCPSVVLYLWLSGWNKIVLLQVIHYLSKCHADLPHGSVTVGECLM